MPIQEGGVRRRVLFRCDAAPHLGGGHVIRCLTLAKAMAQAGWLVQFACVRGSTEAVPALATSGFKLIQLEDPLDHAELLANIETPVELIVLDHYRIDAVYERALRPRTYMTMVIDDLADRAHDCDILVDQTFGREAIDYAELVPAGATVLVGGQYALLRPEFAATRETALARRRATEGVKRILISMGMTDIEGITGDVLNEVLVTGTNAAVDVVLGSRAPSLATVRAQAAERGGILVHVDTADMCALISAADLAIGAAGTTAWERCCLGLPSIVKVLAANQRKIAAELDNAGASIAVEQLDLLAPVLDHLLLDTAMRQQMTTACISICDGLGATRVVNFIEGALR